MKKPTVLPLFFGMLILGSIAVSVGSITSSSSKEDKTQSDVKQHVPIVTDTIENIKIVKNIKEVNETHTSYHYKYDWFNSKFRQQPEIESTVEYYIIYTDGTNEKTTKEKGMFYEKGDTIKTLTYKYN